MKVARMQTRPSQDSPPGSPVRRPPLPILALAALLAALPHPRSQPASAQSADRIWGTVLTTEGDRHEGFLSFARSQNAASWGDVLVGRRQIAEEKYSDWLQAAHDGENPVRTVELAGYRVSWDERHGDFPVETDAAIRVGHLSAISPREDGGMEVVPRWSRGRAMTWEQPRWRWRVTVDAPGGETVEVRSRDVERIEFGAAPTGAEPASRQVYGTVEDRFGRSFAGYVSWTGRPVMSADRFAGRDPNDRTRRIPFAEIDAIVERIGGARVTLASGEEVVLRRARDDGRDDSLVRWHRSPIRLADPALGVVTVPWSEFRSLRVQAAPPGAEYADFGAAAPVSGAVATLGGERIEGRIRWDADEDRTWQHLDGISRGVEFNVELGLVRRVERIGGEAARITLRDGRSFELDGPDGAFPEHRGVFVFPEEGAEWRHVAWEEVSAVSLADRPGR